MKNRPLAIQISLVFVILTLVIALSLGVMYLHSLRSFFTREIFANIESAQDFIELSVDQAIPTIRFLEIVRGGESRGNRPDPPVDYHWSPHAERRLQPVLLSGTILFSNIRHMVFSQSIPAGQYQALMEDRLTLAELHHLREEALQQKETQQRYQTQLGGRKLFYVIRQIQGPEGNYALVSMVWEEYKTSLEMLLFRQLAIGTLIALFFAIILAHLLSKQLTKPLVHLEQDVQRIAKGDWRSRISTQRHDEIGGLAASIETMRQQLVANDESMQASLQYISHELKTPVMVIRSFIQSIKDGIFPKGSLQESLDVIDEESIRLEGKIQDLLYFSKIDYMTKHQLVREELDLTKLVQKVIDKVRHRRPRIGWTLSLQPTTMTGDPQQWVVVLENLLDNQLRYAESRIEINLKNTPREILLTIENDGEHIDESLATNLFDAYTKGKRGKTGLGLAIAKRIVELHGGRISVKNCYHGVIYTIRLPQ